MGKIYPHDISFNNLVFNSVNSLLVLLEVLGLKSTTVRIITDIHVDDFLNRTKHLWLKNHEFRQE